MDSHFIFSLLILLVSVVIHEISHGYTAELLGDPTPKLQGRLTLNPLKHLEVFGSLIVPIITSLGGFTFGWAKPVEYNPYNLKNRRWGELLIALAGPVSNIILALIFGVVARYAAGAQLSESFIVICIFIVQINVILAVFNMVPLPPLDGSKVLFALIPQKYQNIRFFFEQYSLILTLLLVIFLWKFIYPVVPFLMSLILGGN